MKKIELGEQISTNEIRPESLMGGQQQAYLNDVARMQAMQSEFIQVNCPACEESNHQPALQKHGFEFVECLECATLYMNPRPSPEIMHQYYSQSENYQYWAEHIFPASEAQRREKIHRPWLKRVLQYCEAQNNPRELLVEVGAGFGTFSALATSSGEFSKVLAVEPTPEMAKACRERGVDVIESKIEDLDTSDIQADVVVSFEVIEHLFDPRIFLSQCKKILKPGGLLVVSCPNGQGFDIAYLGAGSSAVDLEHVNLFNPQSLSLLVEGCGFKVAQIHTPGRLDADIVHQAISKGEVPEPKNQFFKKVFVEDWENLGWPFQEFLAQNKLSSHMWMAAIRNEELNS